MKSTDLIKPYFRQNRFVIIFGVAGLVLLDILMLIIPRIVKHAVDDLTTYQADFSSLLTYAGMITGLAVVIAVLRYVARWSLFGTSRKIEEGLRNTLFAHIQTLSSSYFDKAKTGDLMAHATNDIQHIRMAAGMGMVAVTDAVFLGIAAIAFMAYINIQLTLLVFIPMPLIIFGSRFFSRKMHKRYQQVQASFSDLTEAVRERFAGIRVIKSFNRQQDELAGMTDISKSYIEKNMGLIRVTGSFFPMMLFFSNLSLAFVLYFGGRKTILAVITPGDFVAFINYLGLLTWPLMAMGWVTNLIQRGRASLDRIHAILKIQSEIEESPDALPLDAPRGEITFENVGFTYPGRDIPALSHINLTLSPGNIIGIVGPQGAGKTTLLNLVPRLYDVTEGRILLDGIDIRDIRIDDLRKSISHMPQEPILFAGTIVDNISFRSDAIDHHQIVEALKKASFDETVFSFPKGLDTVIGEKGVLLSGGQKQRTAFTRALLKDTIIYLFDDPVSQVDKETGDKLIATIRALAVNNCVMIVSHRISAVRFAHRIIILEKGEIAASGRHDELCKTHPYYAKTFALQEMERDFNA
jgi:ATP-binding cassette, subfamily B, multidrug efflux pump